MSLRFLKSLIQSCCLVALLLLPVSAFSEYALSFDGSSRVDLGGANWFPGYGYTIEALIKPDSSRGPSYIFSSSGMWGENVASFVLNGNNISLYTRGHYDSGIAYTSDVVLPSDNYTYVAVTYDGGSVGKIYINGSELPVTSSVVPMPFPMTYSIGNLSEWSTSGYGFIGSLDAVVVSGLEKSASEIADTAQGGLGCGSSAVGCWLFEEGFGNMALDSSGNGHNGIIVSASGSNSYVKVPVVNPFVLTLAGMTIDTASILAMSILVFVALASLWIIYKVINLVQFGQNRKRGIS